MWQYRMYQTNMLYILNLYYIIYQLYLSKGGNKKKKIWGGFKNKKINVNEWMDELIH